ncbi:hypothetical protein ACFVSS_25170 [Peribacillus butanolivorans]|uniref:hypothetical protein n=1 Tax=Peribacillus butanolivorans TaxID=421767 RepID=UPI0036DBD279
MKIKWGAYLWKLRLLLFIPYVFFGIWIFKAIGKDDDFPIYYWMAMAVYTLICSIILHKMEKKEKKEKQ